MERKINDYMLSIFVTGIEQFGIRKAHEYAREIEMVFNQLVKFPDMGKNREELYTGALSFPVGSHIIFYRKASHHIEIARILHKRMDYVRHLNIEPL